MTPQPFPTEQELDARYGAVFSNHDVAAITRWTEPNHSDRTDEAAYLDRAIQQGDALITKMEDAIAGI